MYIIVVYDVNTKRVAKILKYLRRHINWIQNSVFEGEVTPAQYREIKAGIRQRIKESSDSVLFFSVRDEKILKKEIVGQELNAVDSSII